MGRGRASVCRPPYDSNDAATREGNTTIRSVAEMTRGRTVKWGMRSATLTPSLRNSSSTCLCPKNEEDTYACRAPAGRVRLTEGIHPEAIGIAACAGHWTKHQPIAKGKGVFFNDLLEVDFDHTSPVNLNLDLCAKIKIVKCEGAASEAAALEMELAPATS